MKRYLILFLFGLIACGSDSQPRPEQSAEFTSLSEADISKQKVRCIDANLPLLAIKRDLCLDQNYWPDEYCNSKYQEGLIKLDNKWEEIQGSALSWYDQCAVDPLNQAFTGPDYCIVEYEAWMERNLNQCQMVIDLLLF